MVNKNSIKLFGDDKIRAIWDDEQEKWYFSVVDVVAVLTNSPNPQTYWRVLKKRLKDEGNETVTNCNGLKMRAADGKMRLTDIADTEQLLRIIQSVPSPKAEPFKTWLAKVGAERLDQMQDTELSIQQAMIDYKRLGYSDNWINQRLFLRLPNQCLAKSCGYGALSLAKSCNSTYEYMAKSCNFAYK